MNDGSEIYNAVVVEAEAADGTPLNVTRRQPTSVLETTTISSPAPDNPSFATNTTSWTAGPGTLTRTTTVGEFDSGTSGGKLAMQNLFGSSWSGYASETFTGTFIAGKTYTLAYRAKASVAGVGDSHVAFLGVPLSDVSQMLQSALTTSFATYMVTWTPRQTWTSGVTFQLAASAPSSSNVFIDTLSLSTTIPTIVDRRGFRRTKILPVSSALTSDAANQIGDVWLAGHKTTPFKGTLKVTGGGVRRVLGGEPVAPHKLLTMTGQKIRFSNRIDPDTGAWGRDGEIAAVSYDYDSNSATIEIDSQHGNFDALLARLAVIQGR